MNKPFESTRPYTDLVGRVLIAVIFLLSGWSKIAGYAGTQAYMQSAGVPGALLPVVILVELAGGVAIVAGLYTRLTALILAGFSIVAALLFHNGPDLIQHIMFLKNLGLAGGFLFLVANGAGRLSVDHALQRA
ncbi:MAG: DoxX family protein [Betaproteobacteria bacterium]|jgi:putative oxidoreductase|nr:MAG: DoxX family protein [Betaproteobacteria bacterium]